MQARTFEDNDGTKYQRITKAAASKMFDAGETIVVCPVNMRPFGWFGMGAHVSKNGYQSAGHGSDFTSVCNAAEYYGCNHETGYYLAFYAAI